jgi:hypothetical protein
MSARAPTLRRRIEEVEARVAQRQERLQFRWRETERAALATFRVSRAVPLVATAAAVALGYLLLRRPPRSMSAGGLTGVLVAAGLALLRPRYGALYSLAWQLLSRRRSSPSRRRAP